MSSPPIVRGALLTDADGRVAAIGPEREVPVPPSSVRASFPDAVLLPGLVNAHTHLELTHLGGPVRRASFFEWIQHVRRAKEGTEPDAYRTSARQGVGDAWRHGITTIADTGDSAAVAAALSEMGGRGIVFQEVFGPHPDQVDDAMARLVDAVNRLRETAAPWVRVGVSPHAPYSVSGPLYRRVAEYARAEGLPVAVHIAESRAETELVRDGSGAFAAALTRRGIPLPEPTASPVAYLASLGVLATAPLAIHAVQVGPDDLRALADAGCGVAACPESNRAHGHGAPPLAAMLETGLAVGLGTDSVASVGRLDLFREMRAARGLAGLSAAEALRLVTADGARAVGMEGEVGVLRPGAWADLCLVRAAAPGEAATPAERVVAATPDDVMATFVAGRCVYHASGSPPEAHVQVEVGGRP